MSDAGHTALAVIGAGPGGYAAAFMAAGLGLETTLIDVEPTAGGVCLLRGCIPSKTLLHAAKLIREAREAEAWGLSFAAPSIDLDKLRSSTQEVIGHMTSGLAQLIKAWNIRYVQGRAMFVDSNTLAIVNTDGAEDRLHFEHAIVAAGSRPAILGKPSDSPRILNSTTALELESIPGKLLVVGGGYIGLELGTVYAALGSNVTVVEVTDGLLPGADRDLVKPLAARLEGQFEGILLNTKVLEFKEQKNGVKVTLEGPSGDKTSRSFDKALISAGRKPNSSGLGLKNTRAEVDKHGFIQVDAQGRTAEPNIFAIGDIVGGAMLAHKASHEGRVAAEVIAGQPSAFDPMAIPAVVFTDPEIAWCGLTEIQAKQQGRAVEVGRFPWAASGRATTLHRTEGLTKVICDPADQRILGVGMVGAGAGELIAEATLAIEMGANARDLELTIHPHPTLSETLMEAAASLYGTCTHLYRPKKG